MFHFDFSRLFSSIFIIGTVNFDKMKKLIDHIPIIDVRSRQDVESKGMLPKSFNVPVNEILGQSKAFELSDQEFKLKYGHNKPSKNEYFVILCTRGVRAKSVANQLKSLGYSNVIVYPGSFDDWVAKGGFLVNINGGPGTLKI